MSGAILAAALITGDALNANLRRLALERTGGIRSAVELDGRYVDAALADRLARRAGATVAPALKLSASVLGTQEDGAETRIDRVNAYGVDARFFALTARAPALAGGGTEPNAGRILVSPRLAEAAGAAAFSSLRFAKPSDFPLDMPLGDRRDDRTARRSVVVSGVLPAAALGNFSLLASQIPPLNVFADRDWLAAAAGATNRANLLLSDADPGRLEAALREALEPADVGIRIEEGRQGVLVVESNRIYLDEAHVRALADAAPRPVLALHHLADAFEAGEGAGFRETPYGFIAALSPGNDARLGAVPADMPDDAVVINGWLAERLRIGVGDRLTIRWRRFGADGKLAADAASFRVAKVIEMANADQERALLPRFPGLTDVDRCADWDIGMPMDRDRLADAANEEYWNKYGATPKAYVTLAAGRRMLGSVFGSAMSARFPPQTPKEDILAALRKADPRELGLTVRAVCAEALQAANQAMDFRELFGGMAFVLMAAALTMTGLLASLGVAHRREELGVLRSAGFGSWRLTGLWLAESLLPLAAGVVAGVACGVVGARLLVWAMNRFWAGAVASARIPFSVEYGACWLAGALTLGMSLLAVYWGIRRTVRLPSSELLGGRDGEAASGARGRSAARTAVIGSVTLLVAVALLASSGRVSASEASGLFFGAGLLLMVSLLCLAKWLALKLDGGARSVAGPLLAGVLNVARYRRRNLLVMILLATGCFLTVGILAMKQDPAADWEQTWSGSGGFGWMVETSLPAAADKAGAALRKALGAESAVLAMRVRAGDEAGCLNLNRAVRPRLLGVSPREAETLRAFERNDARQGTHRSIWRSLDATLPDGTIPCLAGDLTTVEYGLHASVGVSGGSVYEYTGEDGRIWRLRVVGALPVRSGVLQGSLILDRAALMRLYPSTSGDGLWLVRSRRPEREVAEGLRHALGRYGGIVTPCRERLRLLGAVESTYLDMFLVLGGLGVVLGAAGVGLVALRNAAARRGELAVLRALGVPPRQMVKYLAAEYAYVLLFGGMAGILPALLAVQPVMRTLGQEMPVGLMALLIAAIATSGAAGTFAAVIAAARMRIAGALRGE